MRALSIVSGVVLFAVTFQAPGGAQQAQPTAAQLEANKRAVMEFYRPGITADERLGLIHRNYIQHNAGYVQYAQERNISNHEAFRQIRIAQAQTAAARAGGAGPAQAAPAAPAAPQGNTFHILYADGDAVVRIAQRFAADPQRPGQFYENFWWDQYRLRDGQLYEHWDAGLAAAQPPAAPNPNAPPLMQRPVAPPAGWPPAASVPTPGCVSDPATVAANKKVAQAFFGAAGPDRLALLDASYIEHNPAVRRYAENNRLSHLDAFKAFGSVRPLEVTRAPRASGAPADVWADFAVGSCDVVTFTHKHYSPHPGRTGQFAEHFTFDMFRLRNGRIVEHWDGGTLTATPVVPAARSTGE